MSYAKPIWNEVQSCKYNSSKSWGGFDDVSTTTYTGSSSSNSTELLEYSVSRRFYENFVVFNAYIDGKLIKQNVHLRNGEKAGQFLYQTKSDFVNSKNAEKHYRANRMRLKFLKYGKLGK